MTPLLRLALLFLVTDISHWGLGQPTGSGSFSLQRRGVKNNLKEPLLEIGSELSEDGLAQAPELKEAVDLGGNSREASTGENLPPRYSAISSDNDESALLSTSDRLKKSDQGKADDKHATESRAKSNKPQSHQHSGVAAPETEIVGRKDVSGYERTPNEDPTSPQTPPEKKTGPEGEQEGKSERNVELENKGFFPKLKHRYLNWYKTSQSLAARFLRAVRRYLSFKKVKQAKVAKKQKEDEKKLKEAVEIYDLIKPKIRQELVEPVVQDTAVTKIDSKNHEPVLTQTKAGSKDPTETHKTGKPTDSTKD